MEKEYYRHGDVIIEVVSEIPADAKAVECEEIVLSHSETGHLHVVTKPGAALYEDKGVKYLNLEKKKVVKHRKLQDRHTDIVLPAGQYKILPQWEYEPQGWRAVED